MRKLKILVVTNMYPGANGRNATQGIFVEEQVQGLRDAGHGAIDVLLIDGFRGKLAYLSSVVRVVAAARVGSYDVVHYHFGLSAVSAPVVKWFAKSRIVITFHGSDIMGSKLTRAISLFAARFADACIAVSEEIADRVAIRSKLCRVIPCGVNEKFFVESDSATERRSASKIVVFPSSPDREEKDYSLFQRVVEIIRCGHGHEVTERHINGIDRVGVRSLLDEASCLLLTSRREGSPQSVKEAMAMNLPVVSVDVGDVRTLIGDSDAGAVVDGRDPVQLARALNRVLGKGLRTRGRTRLEELGYFSSHIAGAIWTLYWSLSGEGVTS